MRIQHPLTIQLLFALLLGILFLSACQPTEGFPNLILQPDLNKTDHQIDAPEVPVSVLMGGNRLLVVGDDGNIYTMSPNGEERFALTRDASRTQQYSQPTWSPSGDLVAWTELSVDGDTVKSALKTSLMDGQIQSKIELPFPPFYIYWSPDSEKLVYLSNWVNNNSPSMALRLFNVFGENKEAVTLAQGQPFYMSWAPDSQRMVTHVGNREVALQSIDGEALTIAENSAGYPAPQWSPDGQYLIFALNQTGFQRLIIADLEGTQLRKVTEFDGNITFTLSPKTNHLAYVTTERDVNAQTFGPLYLVDTETNRTQELSSAPVIAFFWSPDGTKLIFMAVERLEGTIGFRWKLWDGERISDYDFFFPSRLFAQRYLPFFDQYAQSMTLWSPDSTAFTYVGINSEGQQGIWVQSLSDETAVRISDGVFGSWSPR